MSGFENKLIVLTWPRWAWKTLNAKILTEAFRARVISIPQLTWREKRDDDDPALIKVVSKEEFQNQKPDMLVYNDKYGIQNMDVKKAISSSQIPICVLWWKEIIKLQRQKVSSIILNITYPYNLQDNTLNNELRSLIYPRLRKRGLDQLELENELDKICTYMRVFFNNPTFQKNFDHNLFTGLDWKEIENYVIQIIKNEFNL